MNPSWRHRLNISRLAVKYPRFTISFWLAIAVAGLFAFSSLKYALFPDVTFPVVIIRGSSEIVNTIENSQRLTSVLETPLLSLDTIESVTSTTYPRETVINTLFYAGKTLEEATQIIRQKIDSLDLPPNTQIEIIPYNLNESMAISYALTSENRSLEEIATIAIDSVIPPLEKIKGILQVNILGLTEDNAVEIGKEINPSIVNFNGESALGLQVIKRGDGNTLEVVREVEGIISQIESQFADIRFNIAQTEADYIQEATQATIDSLILAIILAILVIFPFLRSFYSTLITALAIPLSLLGTFIVMAVASFNLETITLLALALVIGIVVDDAIVEVENISRLIEEGETPKQAALKGSDQIGLTVSASTLTIVAVFLPVAFTTGNVKQFFLPFALTVSAAVMISLLVARTITPVLCMYWLKPRTSKNRKKKGGKEAKLGEKYQSLLKWSLSHRRVVLILAILSFIVGIALIPLIPQGFIPQLDRGEFNVIYTTELPKLSLNLDNRKENGELADSSSVFNWIGDIASNPNGFILRRTRRVGDKIEAVILNHPDVETVFHLVGVRSQPNRGRIYVKLKSERENDTITIQNQIRDSLPPLKGVDVSVEEIKFVDTGDAKPFSFSLISDNISSLYATVAKITPSLKQISGLQDLSISANTLNTDHENNLTMIEHLQGKPAVTFTANLGKGEALGELSQQISKKIQPLLPNDVTLLVGGDCARMGEVFRQFSLVFGFSLLLMLGVLWLLFGSIREPLVVGLSLPLSIVGAMLALLITQSDFGMISLIGFIFLLGLLDKNALLLVDYINQLRQQGMKRREAIILGCQTRLRPILMTTFSTILGMLPIAIGLGVGAQLRQPMAVAIIGGLITSTFLSLVFVPVFYSMLEDFWFQKKANF